MRVSAVVVIFDGLNAFVTREMNPTETSAKEVRVILMDSDYPGNPNINRMTHIPAIEFKEGSYKGQTPRYIRQEGNVLWHGWYLHDKRVAFVGPSKDVTLVAFDKVISLAKEHTEPQFGKMDSAVWDGKATGERVNARVLLQGGSLAVTNPKKAVVRQGESVRKVATTLTWTAAATHVVLSELGTGKSGLTIELDQRASERLIRIVNFPSWKPKYPEKAMHFVEYYDLSAAAVKPGYDDRLKPTAAADEDSSSDAFCPPVKFSGP